jgi:hypothetical protein
MRRESLTRQPAFPKAGRRRGGLSGVSPDQSAFAGNARESRFFVLDFGRKKVYDGNEAC